MSYIHYCSDNRYTFSENLQGLFYELVKRPFDKHPPTPAWVVEVKNRLPIYHRKVILDRGRTDFDEPFHGLSPEDKVSIYCVHYMPMHLVSSYHIFRIHTQLFTNHLTSVSDKVVFIDLGCGPLTSGIAFWAFASQSDIIYLGIDSSQAMLNKAKIINQYGPNRYRDAFFSTFEAMSDYSQLIELLDKYIAKDDRTPIVFNFCYFLSSWILDITDLSDVIVQIVEKYSKHNMCLVYQNPNLPSLHENWDILKAKISGFKSQIIESSVQSFCYDSLITGLPHETAVYNDILYNE